MWAPFVLVGEGARWLSGGCCEVIGAADHLANVYSVSRATIYRVLARVS